MTELIKQAESNSQENGEGAQNSDHVSIMSVTTTEWGLLLRCNISKLRTGNTLRHLLRYTRWGGGGREKLGGGISRLLPKTLPLVMTNIYDFQYPIYNLTLNQYPVSDLPYTSFQPLGPHLPINLFRTYKGVPPAGEVGYTQQLFTHDATS